MDRLNIIQIDVDHVVRPESMLVLQAATEVVNSEGFEDELNNVLDRVNEIEGLHRTRELTVRLFFSPSRTLLNLLFSAVQRPRCWRSGSARG